MLNVNGKYPSVLPFDSKGVDFASIIFASMIVMLYISDSIDKFFRDQGDGRVGFIVKALCVFCIITYSIFKYRRFWSGTRRITLLMLFVSILVTSLIGLIFSGINYNSSVTSSLYMLFRYVSGLFFLVLAINCTSIRFISDVVSFVFIFNALIAWVGLFFDVEIFRTYGHIKDIEAGWVDQRFGFDGLLLEQNNATFFYFAAVANFYWRAVKINGSKLLLLFAICTCMILGTKSIILGILLFFAFSMRIAYKVLLAFLMSILLIYLIFLYSDDFVRYANFEFLNFLLSGRGVYFVYKFIPIYENMDFWAKMFGILAASPQKYLIELDFIDLFMFFGFLGAFIYCLFLFVSSYYFENRATWPPFFFSSLFICSMSGHLFYDPSSMFYFSIALVCSFLASECVHDHQSI